MFLLAMLTAGPLHAFETSQADHLELKWVRDSVEYQQLTKQTFRNGVQQAIANNTAHKKRKGPWVVVFDIDETLLDNSPYFLELAAYDRPFDWPSWDAWCERRTAEPIAGGPQAVAELRAAGARIAFISNRMEGTRQATIDNLMAHGMWAEGDALCLKTDDDAYTKVARRAELAKGAGRCSLGEPAVTLAWFGDTITDFPNADERPNWDSSFGTHYFVLPNPTYGGWEHAVTRPDLRP